MDSGNSSSMQSSSGGDEEYDSRAESLPAFLNPSSHFVPPSNTSQPSSLLSHQQQPTLLDPSPNLFHAFSHSSPNPNPNSSLLNLDVVRSRGLRSDQNCPDLVSSLPTGSSSSQSIMGAQGSSQAPLSTMQLRSVHDNGARSSSPSDQTHVVARNPKKRTRASRRAPTTVLTTDTSNFRAMVQEFTGIPAPPFSGSPFSRRFDLFGTGSGLRSSGHLEPVGSFYPLRPSAQKVHQQSPFVSSSSSPSSSSFLNNTMVDATNIASTTTNNNNNMTTSISVATSTFNPSSIDYQLPSDLGLPKQPQNVINMQNQMLSFQSLIQPLPLLPSLNVSSLGAKSQASLPLPSLEELGMSHGQVNANLGGLPSQVTTEGMRLRTDNSWRDGPVTGSNDGSQQGHLRSFDGNYGNLQRVNSCKVNYSASSSDFHHDKGLENVPSRGEGTVDSWICPSEFRIGD